MFLPDAWPHPSSARDSSKSIGIIWTFIKSQGGGRFRSQPSQGNIADGQTTIEEKGIGNIQKMGCSPVVAVLEPAESPRIPGLNFMDSSSAAAECVTLFGAAGSVLQLFTTGNGNNIGHPIVPVVKVTANPEDRGDHERAHRCRY